jgi:hypothetical protein
MTFDDEVWISSPGQAPVEKTLCGCAATGSGLLRFGSAAQRSLIVWALRRGVARVLVWFVATVI